MKQCSKCGETKEETEYYRCRRGLKVAAKSECKPCTKTMVKIWQQANAGRHQQNQKSSRYGISTLKQREMMELQGGMCARCLLWPATDIDHDHQNNTVRGMLCHGCNLGIALLGDTIEGIKEALVYLKRSQVKSTPSLWDKPCGVKGCQCHVK